MATKPYWKRLEERISNEAKQQSYQSLSDFDAKLHRPDQIIGSRRCTENAQYIFVNNKIVFDNHFLMSSGIYKLFDEVLTNAIDHKIRMDTEWKGRGDKVTAIWISFDTVNNTITVKNNGMGISHGFMQTSEGKQRRIIEQIFTSPNSSSNYDDSSTRLCGGRNGLGVKAATIFSRFLQVECVTGGKLYKQLYEDNGSIIHQPTIVDYPMPDSTTVTFAPDLEYFGCNGISSMLPLFLRRMLDVAILFNDVAIYLNGQLCPIKTLHDYVALFVDNKKEIKVIEEKPGDMSVNNRYRIAIFPTPEGQNPVRFSIVNGVTVYDGQHFRMLINKFYSLINAQLPKFIKKSGMSFIQPKKIKAKLSIVAILFIPNPAFESQTKEKLAMSTNELTGFASFLKGLTSTPFVEFLRQSSFVQSLEKDIVIEFERQLKKNQRATDGVKTRHIGTIPGYTKANKAGTSESMKCKLFVAEGKSASGAFIEARRVFGSGGSDYIGIFAIGGKPINPRQNSPLTVNNNIVFSRLKKILGLSIEEKYETEASLNKLNYGKVVILSDADDDGIHITGLIINLLVYYWPAFMRNGFITRLNTPCVRAFITKKEFVDFYSTAHFLQWCNSTNYRKPKEVRYYKGLASNDRADFEHIFRNFDKNLIKFQYDDKTQDALSLAFDTFSDPRKTWLSSGNEEIAFEKTDITYSEFIHNHYKTFGFRANTRAIPSVYDGLKPAQRKVIFTMLQSKQANTPTKLLVVASRVIEKTLYHHGDSSMHATIIHMAQNFVGANNINLLVPHGYFGTRQYGTKAKNAGSPRYISTSLHPITRTIFHPDDVDLVERVIEEDTPVEPRAFITTVPLILINGSTGIGMGFKSDIPKYNPVDIVSCLRHYIKTGNMPTKEECILRPCWRGSECFLSEEKNRIHITASYSLLMPNVLIVSDLTPMVWIEKYTKYLDKLLEFGVIEDYKTYTERKNPNVEDDSDSKFLFHIYVTRAYLEGRLVITRRVDKETGKQLTEVLTLSTPVKLSTEKIEKDFMLRTSVSTDSMYLMSPEGKIKKYNDKYEILAEFINVRISYYKKRYNMLLSKLHTKYEVTKGKYLFIVAIISGKLEVKGRKRNDIVNDLATRFPDIKPQDGKYDYLFALKIDAITKEKAEQYEQEFKEIEREYEALLRLRPEDLWSKDLDAFEQELKRSFPEFWL